ncbi:CoB--CoM heterodisulfide reductase iron-sulfur subunit B family protein [Mailhella massiliensis]|uniref:CoB--CoM heterodisulfide reductase iron-sulfur subunit B family protein n=1 Tax=Mailhella massiliensis TaxID=1903261 RepID=A0A921AUB0_9BACT|nr:CoB--CoM heterodisulfide reductase iron-sulfur subunit B family protein [Mailhella massiliensis]HJD96221.1 CoB--CoM heterodisulfide reductase iron-sulfur subunit B family protein [Mailhella massiliensis]
MKYAYYPGCSGHGTSVEYEVSTRAVCNALNMDLVEIEDWNCCGSTPAHSISHELSGALAARNLTQAAKTGADCVISPCPSCSSNLKMARYRMQKPDFKARVDELLDEPTPANAEGGADLMETYSVLQAIVEHVGIENVASRVTYPLEGLKVVTYYGCLLSRPAQVAQFDDPENPVSLDNIMRALGAEVLPFALKTECCGAAMGIPDVRVPGSLSGRILDTAKAVGAEAVITACPLCHMNLDLRQRQAARISKKSFFGLPVFYYTQMIALAFGLPKDAMRLDKLAVNPYPLLDKIAERRKARVAAELESMKAAGAAS